MENVTWLLTADSGKARIYSVKKPLFTATHQDLTLVGEYLHEDSRKKAMDLVSDKPGGYAGNAKGRYDNGDPKDHEAERFAIELTKKLDAARNENLYRALVIIASPHFLGKLNQSLGTEVNKLVSLRIEKDYVNHNNAQEFMKHLQHYLQSITSDKNS